MKLIISALLLLIYFTGCTTLNNEFSKDSKKELITKSNQGNIKAMIALDKYYDFPKTIEGFHYYQTWYDIVKNSKNSEQLLKIADVYSKYNDMYINGQEKVLNLYKKAFELGNLDAAIKLIEYDIKNYKKKEAKELQKKILDKLSEKQLTSLYKLHYNYYNHKKQANEVLTYMQKKGYKRPFDIRLKEFTSSLYYSYKEKNKLEIDKFIADVIASKNKKEMYQTALVLKNRYKYTRALKVYEELLKIDDTNVQAYYDVSYIYKKGDYKTSLKKDEKKSLLNLEKAALLGNTKATSELLSKYSYDKKYLDEYYNLIDKLKKTDEGTFTLASFYKNKRENHSANVLFDKLAENGNEDAILELALKKISKYYFNPEDYKLSKKWQEYILDSNNQKLKNKLKEKLNSYPYKYKFDELKEKLSKQKTESKSLDILGLRKLAKDIKYKDINKAIEYYKQAADAGDVYSSKKLADLYLDRKVKKYDMAVEVLTSLINRGDYKTRLKLAELYEYPPYPYKKDMQKALKIYEEYAKKDDIKAIDKLARYYICASCDKDNKIDYKKGIYYTNKLAKLRGYGRDYATLGWVYNFGKGVEIDLEKAKKYYLKAVEKGYSYGYYYLAWLYYEEKGEVNKYLIKLDYKEAKEYLEKGVKEGCSNCKNLLGVFYNDGLGVKKDRKKAAYYFKQIASYNKYAAFHLATYYFDLKKYKKAKEAYEISAKKNYAAASIQLAVLYKNGYGVEKDIEKAILYYDDAFYNKIDSSQKDVASYYIGLIYENGKEEIKKDIKKAISWYKKSNDSRAKKRLKALKVKK